MYKRDANRKFLLVFLLCGVSAAAAAWLIREKFIAHPFLSLLAGAAAAGLIAILFERYLEFRLNASADALIARIRKVREGDLTQRFKEDPDDDLPYGMSYELGGMMAFFRENMGRLWKTSALLSRQLSQLSADLDGLARSFRTEIEFLGGVGRSLNDVRAETQAVSRKISDLKINSSNDSAFLCEVGSTTALALEDMKRHGLLVKEVADGLRGMESFTDGLTSVLDDLSGLCRKAEAVGKSLAELSTQCGLVKLQGAIDASQDKDGSSGQERILDEMQRLAESVHTVRQAASDLAGLAAARVDDLSRRVRTTGEGLRKGLAVTEKAGHSFGRMNEQLARAGADYGGLTENVNRLSEYMAEVDGKTLEWSAGIKGAVECFDRLNAGTQILLIGFRELEDKSTAVRDSLKTLDEFKNLFKIA